MALQATGGGASRIDPAVHDGVDRGVSASLTLGRHSGERSGRSGGRAAAPPSSKWARGEHLIWLTGSALGMCLLMILGLLAVILTNGLGIFWPSRIEQLTLKDGSVLAGEPVQRQAIPNPGQPDDLKKHRVQLKVGNRDLYGFDFKWVDESEIGKSEEPAGLYLVERSEYGPLIGTPAKIVEGDEEIAAGPGAVEAQLPGLVAKAVRDRAAVKAIERDEVGAVNYSLERIRLDRRKLDYRLKQDPSRDQSAARQALDKREQEQKARYAELEEKLTKRMEEAGGTRVTFRTVDGQEKELRVLDIYRAYPANELSWAARARVYASRLWGFLADEPREANTEGGIFPAIFGTVMMVFLMSLAVVPLGVVAALYLREYARQGPLVRTVRIAVNNLAGVPSIVFGVFGLGFFVYFVGGGIDRIFFPEALPTPTYGTGGILWASLTLALLTVPVVIVAAEEALAAVPRSVREASLAMGATKFQTILRVVLPAAAPGILTGLILAMARAAGEVAPLMLTGVVKLAPELPLDGFFPFFHLDRKFMHLGFHIYDVGFQSPNVEAAKPMVYTTTVFLLLIVVLMNVTAIMVRNYLREKYKTSAF
jgi:phosphate transport system permease protein